MDAPDTSPRRHRRTLALVLAAAVSATSLLTPSTAAASPVSDHPEIIATSALALEAHERWASAGDTAAYLAFVDARDRVARGSPMTQPLIWAKGPGSMSTPRKSLGPRISACGTM